MYVLGNVCNGSRLFLENGSATTNSHSCFKKCKSHVGCPRLNTYIVYDSKGKGKSEKALYSYIVVIV
jgi:hypothetical protein